MLRGLIFYYITVVTVLLLFGCEAHNRKLRSLDLGLVTEPQKLPFGVYIAEKNTLDTETVDAIDIWNRNLSNDHQVFRYSGFAPIDIALQKIFVSYKNIPFNDSLESFTTGITYPESTSTWIDKNGHIVRCHVYIDPNARKALTTVLIAHGLGHCLGFLDDAGPPSTVELRSIMARPIDSLGRVTPCDKQRLRDMYSQVAKRSDR